LKPIQIIIIIIFLVSGILAFLLFRQKAGRMDEQLAKKEFGWNPVAIKKMFVYQPGLDTLWLTKQDGIWKNNRHFDGMGVSAQLLVYLSTMQIKIAQNQASTDSLFTSPIYLSSFDKNGLLINQLQLGKESNKASVYAKINIDNQLVILNNPKNQLSLRTLLTDFLKMD
jgi:hypothetical protein